MPVPSWTLPAAAVLGAACSATYWLTPFQVYRRPATMRSGPTRLRHADPVAECSPAERQWLERYAAELEALGFTASPVLRDARSTAGGAMRIFQHAERGEVALQLVAPSPVDTHDAYSSLIFASRLASGPWVYTACARLDSLFSIDERTQGFSVRFPAEEKAHRLYALHRAHAGLRGRTVPVRVDDPIAWQERRELEDQRRWLERGYMREDGEFIRFTLKGAYIAMWRMQWPWKDRLMARDEALRQRLLATTRLNG